MFSSELFWQYCKIVAHLLATDCRCQCQWTMLDTLLTMLTLTMVMWHLTMLSMREQSWTPPSIILEFINCQSSILSFSFYQLTLLMCNALLLSAAALLIAFQSIQVSCNYDLFTTFKHSKIDQFDQISLLNRSIWNGQDEGEVSFVRLS